MRAKVGSEPANSFATNRNFMQSMMVKEDENKGREKVMRIIVERFYLTTFWGRSFERLVGTMATVTSIAFIVLTYFNKEDLDWFELINFMVLCVLLLDLIIKFYISTHRLSFVTSRN